MTAIKPFISIVVLACAASSVFGQESVSGTVEGVVQAAQVFEGRIIKAQSTVRSGPSENYYPVTRLDEGTILIVNGIKFDWLRVVPPEGVFSLIAKDFVTVSGGTGRVKGDNVNVRAGSNLNSQYATIQTKLVRGDVVTVLGEVETRDGVFLKIKSPPGSYLYVHKDLVVPVRVVAQALPEPRTKPVPTTTPPVAGTTRPVFGSGPAYGGGTSAGPDVLARDTDNTGIPGTQRVDGRKPSRIVPTPEEAAAPVTPRAATTQELARASAQEAAEKLYDEADRLWRESSGKPLDQQPLEDLVARFTALSENEDLPITLRQQAQGTVGFIKARNETKQELMAVKKQQDEMQARLKPLRDQNEQLKEQFRQLDMTTYTAVGELQTSTLQDGGHLLLRLVDPKTGHTLVYLRTTDSALVGKFVGVKGSITRDEALGVQIITPKAVVGVDPETVGKSISAEISPASLRAVAPATQP